MRIFNIIGQAFVVEIAARQKPEPESPEEIVFEEIHINLPQRGVETLKKKLTKPPRPCPNWKPDLNSINSELRSLTTQFPHNQLPGETFTDLKDADINTFDTWWRRPQSIQKSS